MKNINTLTTSLNNGYKACLSEINVPCNNLSIEILKILKYSGYIYGYNIVDLKTIKVFLKYNKNNPALDNITQLSTSKKKVYIKVNDINPYNLNLYIVSTNLGILSHYDALKLNVGGELLLKVS
jgi:small subunit ribosomal protein S8